MSTRLRSLVEHCRLYLSFNTYQIGEAEECDLSISGHVTEYEYTLSARYNNFAS